MDGLTWVGIAAGLVGVLASLFAVPVGAVLGFLMPPAVALFSVFLMMTPLVIATFGLAIPGFILACVIAVPISLLGSLPSAFSGGVAGAFVGIILLFASLALPLIFMFE